MENETKYYAVIKVDKILSAVANKIYGNNMSAMEKVRLLHTWLLHTSVICINIDMWSLY